MTPNYAVEILEPERVTALWPTLEPMFRASCKANAIANTEMEAEDIKLFALVGQCAIVSVLENDTPAFALAVQFNESNGQKGVDILGMGGSRILKFKALYWEAFLDWLRANDVKFLDAYVPTERINLYIRRMGFDKSCAFVRKLL